MSWLEAIWLAAIHRETYTAILKSWVPHGKRGSFARQAGISREYLSYLCTLDEARATHRLPSPKTAKKIAAALPAPREIRQSLIENMELAHVSAARAYYTTREYVAQQLVRELLAEIGRAHGQATFGSILSEVQRTYRVTRDASASLLRRLSPEIYPASFAQTCLYLHDAQCVLDRADDALRYAKLAALILENPYVYEAGYSQEQIDYLAINAIRGEGVAYHNLSLYREAPRLYERSITTPAYRNNEDFWKPIIGRDLLNAMAKTPRFSIRKAKEISGEIDAICERTGDELKLYLARVSWLCCLIQHERWRPAERILREEIERIPRLPYVGALHRSFLLKNGALMAWKMGDLHTWKQRIVETVTLMQRAGLKHQLHIVQRQYGEALKPILEELELPDE
jgi:tetratricopeptide (TPR) repeat protein